MLLQFEERIVRAKHGREVTSRDAADDALGRRHEHPPTSLRVSTGVTCAFVSGLWTSAGEPSRPLFAWAVMGEHRDRKWRT